MELTTLNQNIAKKQQFPYYIFAGLETTIRDIYIRQIGKVFNLEIVHYETIEQVFQTHQKNLFNAQRLYVVKEDKDLLSSDQLIAKLNAFHGKSSIVVCYMTIDKRKTFYKTFEDEITWFHNLPTSALIPYVMKEIPDGDNDFYDDLVYVCGNDYGRVLLEINKCIVYSKTKLMTPQSAFYELLSLGVTPIPEEDRIFEIGDSLMAGKFFKVLQDIEVYKAEDAIKNLSAFYSIVRNFYLVYTYHNKGHIEVDLDIPKFIIKKIKDIKCYFTVERLELVLDIIFKTIIDIMKGKISSNIALQYAVVAISDV